MRTQYAVLFIFIFTAFSAVLCPAQQELTHTSEVYALASSLGGADLGGNSPAAGFRFGVVWKPSPSLGLVADVARNFVSDQDAGFTSLLGGVRFYSLEHYRLSGFTQLFSGAERATFAGQAATWNYVLDLGAGVDIRLTRRLAFRALEGDLTLTRAPGLVRVSSGFVYRFGG